MHDMLLKDTSLIALKSALYKRRGELLIKINGLAHAHAGRRAAQREIAKIDAELQQIETRLAETFRSMLLEERRAAVFEMRRTEQKLAAAVEAQSKRATWYATHYRQGLDLDAAISRLQQRLASIEDRVDFLMLEQSAPGFIRMEAPAMPPISPFKGGRKKLFLTFLIMAVAVGSVLPIAIDVLDPRLHAPGELQKILGFPPMGWILDRNDGDAMLLDHEQVSRLAARLENERRTQGSRIFVFTASLNFHVLKFS